VASATSSRASAIGGRFRSLDYRNGVIDTSTVSNETARSEERGEARETLGPVGSGPGEVSHRNSGNSLHGRGRSLSGPSQTSERDPMVFGFIIAYLGRPRRIIAHEDPTRREIYGRTRCNSPTETGRHSQINSAERRHESPSSPPRYANTRTRACTYTRAHRTRAGAPSKSASPRTSSRRKTPPKATRQGLFLFFSLFPTARSIFMRRGAGGQRKTSSRSTLATINRGRGGGRTTEERNNAHLAYTSK